MSLRGDFCNYFRGTYVAVRNEDGTRSPFYIEDVVSNSRFQSDDFSDEHRNALRFVGTILRRLGSSTESFEISVVDPRLELESPDIGYMQDSNGRVRWVRYKPSRNRLKGIHQQKLVGLGLSINYKVLYRLFNPEFEGLVNMHTFIQPSSNIIYYKGVAVGKVIDGVVNLLEDWAHLSTLLPNYRVRTVPTLEFPRPPRVNPFGEEVATRNRYRPRELRNNEDEEVAESAPRPFTAPRAAASAAQTYGRSTRNGQPHTAVRPTPMPGESLTDFGNRLAEYYQNR